MKRDGACTSIWQTSKADYKTMNLSGDTIYDVIVVGAGITGVTTALLLQKAGKSCILADAANAGFGTTGGTTAHINTFYDTPYYQMIKDFGEENAALIAAGATNAIDLIKSNIAEYNIDCSFEEKDAYLFSLDEKQDKELEQIVESANQVGVPMKFTDQNPFPIAYQRVAQIPGQAQFNPIQYLFGLIKAFETHGGQLVESCRVDKIEEGDILEAHTDAGIIRARSAVYATHIPPGVNLLHFRCAPYRSYVLGLILKEENYPSQLGYDMEDPYHYYRTQQVDGQKYLIVGGEDHKTGHEENTQTCFTRLENHARGIFKIKEVAFRWSSQYFEPNDGLPYIGHLPGNGSNVYVATGFGGNGMMYGTLSGIVLSDILVKGDSHYRALLDPNRVKPVAGFSNFVKEGADVVGKLISSIFPAEKLKELSELAEGEAKIVKYEGRVMGLYKDDNSQLHGVNTTCPHIKCSVAWNNAEKSWDCPCHGSRFSYDGKLLTAPAVNDLQRIDLTKLS